MASALASSSFKFICIKLRYYYNRGIEKHDQQHHQHESIYSYRTWFGNWPDIRVDPAKRLDLGLHRLTQVNPNQLEIFKKKIFEILIFHIKKLWNNSCEYKLYML